MATKYDNADGTIVLLKNSDVVASLRKDWAATTEYKYDDVVKDGTKYYACDRDHTSATANQPSMPGGAIYWSEIPFEYLEGFREITYQATTSPNDLGLLRNQVDVGSVQSTTGTLSFAIGRNTANGNAVQKLVKQNASFEFQVLAFGKEVGNPRDVFNATIEGLSGGVRRNEGYMRTYNLNIHGDIVNDYQT